MAGGMCDTCGVCDSKGVPCYLMFRVGADVQSCGAYVKDEAKHAELDAGQKKQKKGAGKEVSSNG